MNHIVELSEQLGISSNDLSSTSGTNPPDVDQEKTTPTSVPSAASASHNSAKEDSSTSISYIQMFWLRFKFFLWHSNAQIYYNVIVLKYYVYLLDILILRRISVEIVVKPY